MHRSSLASRRFLARRVALVVALMLPAWPGLGAQARAGDRPTAARVATGLCPSSPVFCRQPLDAGRSKLALSDKGGDSQGLGWKFTKGEATQLADYGSPLETDDFELCLYDDGVLVATFQMPAGGTCPTRECWRDRGTQFLYKDKEATPDGMTLAKLAVGVRDGDTKIILKGRGANLALPSLLDISGVLDVRLHRSSGADCWGASFSPPFRSQDASKLKAASDAPVGPTTTTSTTSTTLLFPEWSDIHAKVIGPICGGCHGGSGGLDGLAECASGYAALVNVPSVALPSMDRVEPGDSTLSWIMHKIDGTQKNFNASCQGGFCGSRMPLGSPLSQNRRDTIRAWINDGAINDCP
jgi:hypothetical protein